MNTTKIVIVGGGFGGSYTAQYLNSMLGDSAEITLINKSNYFLFTPLLPEVATGGLTPQSIVEPLREIFRGHAVSCVEDTVIEIKTDTKEVITTHATYSYDYAVIGAGAETNYFGVSGARENTFTLKDLNDAITLRNHIISTFEQAVKTKNKDLLSYAVIGAGATGVELAGEFEDYIKHTLCSYYKDSGFSEKDVKISLITNLPEILAQFPATMRKHALSILTKKGVDVIINSTVSKIEPHLITFADGKSLQAHTIVWVAGVKPSLSEIKGIEAGLKGRMEINEYLQNIKHPEIFGLGDASGTLPMLAQIAVQQAKTVTYNINALISKKELKKFKTNVKGLLISLGKWSALGHFKGITLRGPLMWWLWRTIYLFNFHSWKKRLEIAVEWTVNLFYPRDITYIK